MPEDGLVKIEPNARICDLREPKVSRVTSDFFTMNSPVLFCRCMYFISDLQMWAVGFIFQYFMTSSVL